MLGINIMESIRRKIVSLINSGLSKVCVVSLTKFYNFLKLCLLNIIFKKMLMIEISSFLWGLDKGLYGIYNRKIKIM